MDNKIKELYKSISKEDLAKAVDEIAQSSETGIIPEGVIKEYTKKTCDIIGEKVQSVHLFTTTVGLTQEAAFRWNELRKFPFFYPVTNKSCIGFETEPVKITENGACVEICTEGEENFYSVYRLLKDLDNVGVYKECIADFATKEQALDFERLIKQICNNYTDEKK